jgi:hypothetical protein
VRTWDDLVVRAAMAVRWNLPIEIDEAPYPDSVIADLSSDFAQRAGEHVVRGVLDLIGLQFDVEGRLI